MPAPNPEKMNGLTMVAPWEPFKSDPMNEVRAVAANWIAVVPYAYTPGSADRVIYNEKGRQWWGERPEGVVETVHDWVLGECSRVGRQLRWTPVFGPNPTGNKVEPAS